MAIKVQIHDSSACITMPQRFGFHMHRNFKDVYTPLLDNATVHEVEVEFSKVTYFDSSMLDMLMQLYESAKEANKLVFLLNPSSFVLKVFGAANFNTFNIKHTASPNIQNRRILGERRESVAS